MKTRKWITVCLAVFAIFATGKLQAQSQADQQSQQDLYNTIANRDSVMFAAYNAQNMQVFKGMFTEDLEWYQDNDGLVPYATVFKNFQNHFEREFKLTRQLVKSSLEVYPIKDYGAIEIGSHQFRHIENGKEETGTFRFVMIWKKAGDVWKISRVISFGHQ